MAVTPNLGLHQWAATDSFLRTDFNTDFSKIDAAVAAAPTKGYVAGTYQGKNNFTIPTGVNLGFSPSAVIICQMGTGAAAMRMICRGQQISYNNQNILKITETGFEAGMATDGSRAVEPILNGGYIYGYLAFR